MKEVILGVSIKNDQCVVVGRPIADDETHDCDAMGCSSIEHVLWRGSYEVETKGLTDELIRAAVYKNGGSFHGPNIEHVSIEEKAFFKMVRELSALTNRAEQDRGD